MTELVKIIQGEGCDVYSIIHHERILIGHAVPEIEIYQDKVNVPTIGSLGISYKSMRFSVIICPDPKMEQGITTDKLEGLTSFDLVMKLPRKDGKIIDFKLYDITDAVIEHGRWEFSIDDAEVVNRILNL